MTPQQRIVMMAAADFIRRHPNGLDDRIKLTMADTLTEVASAYAAPPPVKVPKEDRQRKLPLEGGPSMADVHTMLRAGSYSKIHPIVARVFEFLVWHTGKAYTASQVAKRLRVKPADALRILARMAKRNVVKRVGRGQYQAG